MTDQASSTLPVPPENRGDFLFYRSEDGRTRVQVRIEGETVWLTQAGLVELYQTTKQNISLHINNVLEEGEIAEEATVKEYLTVQTEGGREVQRRLKFYNLEMILGSRIPCASRTVLNSSVNANVI